MDNLTHTAVGLFLSRAGLNRWTPRATAIVIVAANMPDIDILALTRGSLNYLHYHRQWTHSLLAMPLLAILSVLLVRWVSREPVHWLGAFAAAMVGVASHIVLDLTNAYGVRVLLPFSADWVRWDFAAFPDPWTWSILFLGLAAPFLSRMVGSEISSGAARVRHYGRGGAVFALLLLALYDGGRAVLHARAVSVLESRLYQGAAPRRVAACATPNNPLRWRGIIDTGGLYGFTYLDLAREFDPTHVQLIEKPDPEPALDAAAATPAFAELARFAVFPLWRVWPSAQLEDGKQVQAFDLRFGSPQSPMFVSTALVDGRGRVVQSSFRWSALASR